MNQTIILNDKPAVKIKADIIRRLDKATLYDCEGDHVWVPNSLSKYDEKEGTLRIEEWFYSKLTEEGKL